jgi:hypothetical protein
MRYREGLRHTVRKLSWIDYLLGSIFQSPVIDRFMFGSEESTRRGNRPLTSTSFHTIIIIQRSENHTHRHFHNTKARVTLNMTATTTARRPPSTVAVGPRAIVLNESPSVTPSGSYSAANSNGVTVNIIGIGESMSFSACYCWWWW